MAEYTALTPDGKFLLHYGVKDMKWGKHNSRLTREQLEQETGKGIRKTTSPKIGYTPRIKNDGDKESKDSKVEKVGRPRVGVNYTQQSLQSAYTDQLRRSYTKQEDPKGNKKKGTKKVKSGSSAKNSGGSKRTSTKSSTTSKKR